MAIFGIYVRFLGVRPCQIISFSVVTFLVSLGTVDGSEILQHHLDVLNYVKPCK